MVSGNRQTSAVVEVIARKGILHLKNIVKNGGLPNGWVSFLSIANKEVQVGSFVLEKVNPLYWLKNHNRVFF